MTQQMMLERYSHVMHLVSEVRGTLRADLDALGALAAAFPAGTVSGAPKVRAMEIIDQLEPSRRGPYAGAVGYFGWGAHTLDTAIAIRTAVIKGGGPGCRPGPASWPTRTPKRSWRRRRPRPAACSPPSPTQQWRAVSAVSLAPVYFATR